MSDEDDKARRVEAGIWSVDAQAWKKRALEAEAEVERLRAENAAMQVERDEALQRADVEANIATTGRSKEW